MGDLSFRLHTGNGELIQDELNFAEGKLKIDGVKIPSGTEVGVLDGVTAGTVTASKAVVVGTNKNIDTISIADGGLKLGSGAGTAVTSTAAELNKCDGIPATAYQTVMEEVLFTEAGEGTYTGTIALPAGARIIDIGVDGIALWDAATSASLVVGDGDSANGFFTATDLKTTDLLVGEINNIEHPGGKAGAYIASEQRKLYAAGARNVIGVVTTGGAGTAGRTRLYVVYAVATAAAATKA